MPVERLRAEGLDVTGVFYNPNIHPLKEYLLRREAAEQAAALLELPLLKVGPEENVWNVLRWMEAVPHSADAGRCRTCYALRLERVARWAKAEGFAAFSTSLLYSRHQQHDVIREEGECAAARAGVGFAYRDFRPWWKEGGERSKEWGLYRQQYCACLYSEVERYQRDLRRKGDGKKDGAARSVFCPPIDSGAAKI